MVRMKTIIFDFGNVVGLFDHQIALGKLTPYTDLSAMEMFQSVYAGPLEDRVERGHLAPEDFLAEVHRTWRLCCPVDFLHSALIDIFTPNPEVIDLIPILKKRYRILLGSNTNRLHAAQFQQQFAEVLSLFDHLVLSHLIGHRKPDPEFFEHVQTHAGAAPHECVFIDDMPVNIQAAQRHGWKGILYHERGKLKRQLAEVGIDV